MTIIMTDVNSVENNNNNNSNSNSNYISNSNVDVTTTTIMDVEVENEEQEQQQQQVQQQQFSQQQQFLQQQQQQQDYLFRCAICHTTEGDSSNLSSTISLQTNATVRCGHQFCNTCIDRELARKREFPCPICQTPVKRVTLTQRTLDAVQCEKDTSWRRRLLAVYNKTQNDFTSLKEYNDYLEDVEDMIYSIVNEEPNAEECKARIKEYEIAHRAEIVIRQSQRADMERSIQDLITAEQYTTQRNRIQLQEEKQHILYTKRKFKQESTEVLLGERAEVSAELLIAQMQGYKNELVRRNTTNNNSNNTTIFVSPKVREPSTGLITITSITPELYNKRQIAGGGIPVGSIANQERNWNETYTSLFAL